MQPRVTPSRMVGRLAEDNGCDETPGQPTQVTSLTINIIFIFLFNHLLNQQRILQIFLVISCRIQGWRTTLGHSSSKFLHHSSPEVQQPPPGSHVQPPPQWQLSVVFVQFSCSRQNWREVEIQTKQQTDEWCVCGNSLTEIVTAFKILNLMNFCCRSKWTEEKS